MTPATIKEPLMKRTTLFGWVIFVIVLLALACQNSPATDPSLENTRVALAIQETSLAINLTSAALPETPVETLEAAIQPTYTPYPTYTKQAAEEPTAKPQPTIEEQPTTAPPTIAPTATPTNTPDKLFQQVSADRRTFYCIASSGPTTLTITVVMSDIDRGAALFWRLNDKFTGNTTEWGSKDMIRAGANTRAFTFNADSYAGTNNFYYPPLMNESWFEIQIISGDGVDRTKVFSEVTFFPCAQ
jgi:hypothetical protein